MVTQADVRRLALALPGVREARDRFAFFVRHGAKDKGIAWVWLQRVDPRKPRVPCADVLAVRVANADAKQMLLLAAPDKFFTEAHYDGYSAVLVRLAAIGLAEMRALLRQAWEIQAPKALRAAAAGAASAARGAGSTSPGKPTQRAAKRALKPRPERTSRRPKPAASTTAAVPRRPRRAPA